MNFPTTFTQIRGSAKTAPVAVVNAVIEALALIIVVVLITPSTVRDECLT